MVFFFESLQNRRVKNEDSYCHLDMRLNHEATVSAYAVADGMGGLSQGERYSREAIRLWYEGLLRVIMSDDFKGCSLKNQIDTLKEFSAHIFAKINEILYEDGMDHGVKGGTTLTTAIHFWDLWIFANCGDSPIYLIKDGKITLSSEIQNLAWKMVRDRKTKEGSILFYQNKNRLLEYLGRRENIHPYSVSVEDSKVDAVILGTDGAYGNLSMESIGEILMEHEGKPDALSMLLKKARDEGETDNQTAILIYADHETAVKNVSEEVMEPVYKSCEEETLGSRLINYLKRRRS